VSERLRGHPPRADLHPREDRGVEHERPQPGQGQAPGRGAPAGTAAHHDRVVLHPRLHRERRILSFWPGVTRMFSTALATSIAWKRSPSKSIRLCTYASRSEEHTSELQ